MKERERQLTIPPRSLHVEYFTLIALLLSCPFLYTYYASHSFSPFKLTRPDFLLFFLCFWASIVVSYVIYRYLDNRETAQVSGANFPEDVSPFQIFLSELAG
jgi:hypothetical protein